MGERVCARDVPARAGTPRTSATINGFNIRGPSSVSKRTSSLGSYGPSMLPSSLSRVRSGGQLVPQEDPYLPAPLGSRVASDPALAGRRRKHVDVLTRQRSAERP